MPVAAANCDRGWMPGEPPRQRRSPVRVEPAPVPDLEQRRPPCHRRGPAHLTAVRVINGQQPARLLGPGQPVVGRLAEVHPADVAERIGVALVGGHLLPGQQGDAVRRRGGRQLDMVAGRVVVGHGEEVKAALDREPGQLGHGQHAVGVHRVRVQVAGQPAHPAGGGQVARAKPVGDRGDRLVPGVRNGATGLTGDVRGQRVADAGGGNPVQSQHYLPGAGLEVAGQVSGGGRPGADHEGPACPARPAAESGRAEAAQVKDGRGGVVVELDS